MDESDLEELRWLIHRAMHTEHHARHSCEGKRRFETFAMAANIAQARRGPKGENAARRPYHCLICKGWHIGNTRLERQIRLDVNRRRRGT
ncbi:MAG TPA: hypothetical protein VF151_10725 [Gemmatimonadales bacterium]